MMFDADHARDYLSEMYADTPGRISLCHTKPDGSMAYAAFDTVGKSVDWAAAVDEQAAPQGIYHRQTTVVGQQEMVGKRGVDRDSCALPGLWADLDFGLVGHNPSPTALPLPPTAEDALKMIDRLPAPSVLIHSGGGWYPQWRLDQPLMITDENRAEVTDLSRRWQLIIEATANGLGWSYGAGVYDMPRVLRLPGSVNRKQGQERPCEVVERTGRRYSYADLLAAAADAGAPVKTDLVDVSAPLWETPSTGDGPFDLLDQHVGWCDILKPHGWTEAAPPDGQTLEAWRRPGGTHPVSAKVLKVNPYVLVNHSEDSGLPTGAGNKLTKGRVYALLNHDGDESAAAKALLNGAAQHLPAAFRAAVATLPAATTTTAADAAVAERTPEEAAAEWHRTAVAAELRQLRVRAEARAILDAETRPGESTDLDAEYLTLGQLADLPQLAPLIEGVLSRDTYAILRGRDASFKSFVALDWSLCLATGKAWQARPVQRTPVLYVAGEGVHGIADRVRAWEYAWGVKVDPAWFTVRKSAVNLFRPGPAFEDLLRRAARYGFIVLDTMRRHSGGADGNTTDMGVVVDNIDRIKRATDDGTVLVPAHTGKSDIDARGFSGIEDDADTVWHAERDGMRVGLECTKQKDGPDGFKIDLEMHAAGNSLIVSAGTGPTTDEDSTAKQTLMLAMTTMFAQTGATATDVIEATGMAKTTFYRVRGKLLDSGRLVLSGTKARPRLELP